MDAACVKFVMWQCLLNRADWGLTIGFLNIVYSFVLVQLWIVIFFQYMESKYYSVKWVLLYGFNIMFNVITMMRIVKRESISVFYWICETSALLIFRIHHLYNQLDDFWLAKEEVYIIVNKVIDGYIFLSLLAMIYVMCGLHSESDRLFPQEDEINDHKHGPEAKTLQGQENVETIIEQNLEPHIDREMEELNRKANLKLATMMEEKSLSSREELPPCEPTAPPEDISEIHQIHCEPSAPPESKLSLDEDFFE
ncbi:hypothetical protein KR009_009743, partial [Drosophila setifemur]